MTNIVPTISNDSKVHQKNQWIAVLLIGLLTFANVTTEMLPIGLLTQIAESFDSSTGEMGGLMSIPAIIAAVFAPVVVLFSREINRRFLILFLIVLLILANFMAAVSLNMTWLLLSRGVVGFCIGGIWAIAGGLATRLVSPVAVGLATSIIFGGISAASVLGVPFSIFIGNLLGWRDSFYIMALFLIILLIFSYFFIPSLPAKNTATVKKFIEQLSNKKIIVGLLIILFLVSGHFMAFTFVRPVLQSLHQLPTHYIGVALFFYGVFGILGNFILGLASSKKLKITLIVIILGLAFSMILFSNSWDHYFVGLSISLLIWGFVYGGVSVSLMTWMMVYASKDLETVSALYVSVFNIGIGLGAFLGGIIIDYYGLITNLRITSVILFLTIIFIFMVKSEK
ncbi:MFS transporter [Acinetobacter stercoris]|uniref:Purine ribonucleoside efflux pump NepI n=1 Tax=Acinetobacter stercoris TaxID=2126983 RepID=A0A2U3MV68_9GAMM|nr:MFS transporter [Acinetobacter stercoris]SPL69328.1 Purine ribonucleoside efflux pump NepI [Acinetobacter stercoris]